MFCLLLVAGILVLALEEVSSCWLLKNTGQLAVNAYTAGFVSKSTTCAVLLPLAGLGWLVHYRSIVVAYAVLARDHHLC
jgi:hypothetical protein